MADKFVSAEAAELIEKSITEVVEANGYEVVEIKYFKEYGRYNLTDFIWSKDRVDLNGCETVHNALDPIMDKYEELFPEEYVLNVSSSGLDRPIVTMDDFRRALDTEIEVKDEKGKRHGKLISHDENSFTILTGDKNPKEITISKTNVKIQPYIRF